MPWNKDGTRKKSAFYLKSGNTTPFKEMGSSPAKHWRGGKTDEEKLAAAYHNEHMRKESPAKQKPNPYKGWHPQDIAVDKLATRTDLSKVQFEKKLAKITKTVDPYPNVKSKSSMPKNFNMTGSSKAGKLIKWAKKAGKFLGGKTLGVAGMMMATSSKADQPKKGKGKVEYPGGKIDFTK